VWYMLRSPWGRAFQALRDNPARAESLGISITTYTMLAFALGSALAGIAVGQQWRYAYLFGVLPALLIVWVRANVREPKQWRAAVEEAIARGGQIFQTLLRIDENMVDRTMMERIENFINNAYRDRFLM